MVKSGHKAKRLCPDRQPRVKAMISGKYKKPNNAIKIAINI